MFRTTKQKSLTAGWSSAKYLCFIDSRETKDEAAEIMEEEGDDTLLMKADIPKIVEAVLSNLLTEDSDSTDNYQKNSRLDLEQVIVLPHNRQTPRPTSDLATSSQTPDSFIPLVPPRLVSKIQSGAFEEMGDLVPTHLSFEDTAETKLKHWPVTNISEWLQVFAVYVSVVIARKQIKRRLDLTNSHSRGQ